MSASPERVPRPRRRRSVTESLGSIVLGFEVIVVFLAALVVAGLGRLPWVVALPVGIGLCVLMLVTVGVLRYPSGVWLGWFCQAVFMAGGLLVGEIFIVAALFVGIWAYCIIVGGRVDRDRPPSGATA
ncbi:DUF4233 domain-containing protein [Herbiconiux sp. L3-i23]|uniref:DUF4233 domain-containing protein n=1 Tax=Herbiconiux sp. L3-i23 TaxID=2905871 RepID=UPI00204ABB5F|nr:DUF4233 domain-containing protein [Herbiconiux sp. L3-i23]BDI23158.1 hypothetical protein L3i23_19340 [Herbiconiux sp. L3-i23]